jgi:hypothetical protein
MKISLLLTLVLLTGTACYQQQDPVVRAAQDLQRMANDLVAYDEDRTQRFQSLRLGMSPGEVIKILGPPETQRLIESNSDEQREEWTYRASLRPLGTLTFVNSKLVEVRSE